MKFLPSLEEVQKIAAEGAYKVIPVSCELLSDICTPIEALKILKNVSTHCYLLESVAEKEKWGSGTAQGVPDLWGTVSPGIHYDAGRETNAYEFHKMSFVIA